MSQQSGPRHVQVTTNFFKITGLPKKLYYQYDAFEPTVREASRRIDIFQRLQNHTEPEIFRPKVIYDSNAIAYSSRVLPFGNSASFDVNMTDHAPSVDETGKQRGVFTVILTRVDAAPIEFQELARLVSGQTRQFTPRTAVSLNLIQLILRQAPNLQYANNVRSFFCREAGHKDLNCGLEVVKGFFQSVRPTYRALLVNVDTSCSVMYKEGSMLEIAISYLGGNRRRNLDLPEGSPDFKKLKSFFKNVFVRVTHGRVGRKRIANIVPRAGLVEFMRTKDGIEFPTTVQAYFADHYNYHIQYPEAIGIQTKSGAVIPIELCIVEPNQRYTRKLPQEMTKAMVEYTSEKPKARLEAIRRGVQGHNAVLDYASSPFIQDAGMQVATSPTVIDGKVLPAPPLQYRSSTRAPKPDGSWNVVEQQFCEPRSFKKWAVVDYSHPRKRQDNEKFIEMLVTNCQKLGMSAGAPSAYITGNGSNVYDDFKQATIQTCGIDAIPDLILVILPSSAPDIRLAVKQCGDVHKGIVTQCVRIDNISKAKDQYCNNVAMKINAKLGGINAVPQSGALNQLKNTIIMGADVGHPSPGMNDQPSVASLPPRTEIILELQQMVKKAVTTWGNVNKAPPTSIFFFRDGLSESEYEKVAGEEIKAIQAGVNDAWKENVKNPNIPQPKLTFIVVTKRHHVRFFPNSDQFADRSGNCPAGFVADQGIGNPIAKDFYLQSHGGLLGTSRPSHYVVIKDDNFSDNIDRLQELSFALCHSYARATRSVSIPAPVYYADLVCGRANFHFRPDLKYDDSSASVTSGRSGFDLDRWRKGFRGPHQNLNGKMYFM